VCAAGETLPGIDVSKYQGAIDWNAVANAGIVYTIIRVSHGVNTLDEYFDDNWAQSRAAGIYAGVYQYFEPGQDVIAQADILLDRMGPLGPEDLPPVLDVESTTGLPPDQVAAAVGQWIDHVEAAIGTKPIIYTGRYFWQDNVGSNAFSDYPLWIAHYTDGCPNIPDQWSDWVFHQYTSSGSVAGIGGAVDRDNFNGGLDELLSYGAAPAVCGDGKCTGEETPDSCGGDCVPCGVIDPLGATIDDGDACYGLFGPQEYWRHETAGEAGDLAWTAVTSEANASNYAQVELFFAEAGRYSVEAHLVAEFAQSKQASYAVTHGGGTANVPIDQSAQDGWVSLGEYDFKAGGQGQSIYTGDNTGEDPNATIRLCLDAFRFTRLDPPASDGGGTDGPSTDDGGAMESSGDDGTGGPLDPTDADSSDDGHTNALPPGLGEGQDAGGCGCAAVSGPDLRALWLAFLAAPIGAWRSRRRRRG
jgi:GH25 family lysozyme M1 (1,4-beta-N-acetylmuramidase)